MGSGPSCGRRVRSSRRGGRRVYSGGRRVRNILMLGIVAPSVLYIDVGPSFGGRLPLFFLLRLLVIMPLGRILDQVPASLIFEFFLLLFQIHFLSGG